MRYLTPAIDVVLGLFTRCYERTVNGWIAPTWHLVALPGAGAIGDQDAWTMAALGFARDVHNRLEQDLTEAAMKPKPVAKDAESINDDAE